MSTSETRLANGLRVVSHRMPSLESVSMGIWVGVGARHEIARAARHLAPARAHGLQGHRAGAAPATSPRRSRRSAASSMPPPASRPPPTSRRVLPADIGLGLDILADILQHPRHAEDELEREREVILQEIAATRDSPDEIAYELLQETAFPDQSIGRPDPRHRQEREGVPARPTCASS